MFAKPKILLILIALLEGFGGVQALVAPGMMLKSMFPKFDVGTQDVAAIRAFGVATLALAGLAVLGRNASEPAVARPVLGALLVYNVLIGALFGYFVAMGITGPFVIVFHSVISAALIYYWVKIAA